MIAAALASAPAPAHALAPVPAPAPAPALAPAPDLAPVPLAAAREATLFGGKATQLGALRRARLPVPDGIALSWALVDDVVAGDPDATRRLLVETRRLGAAVAVRSSAVGEDSVEASFAGVHASFLNVTGERGILDAVRAVHASGSTESAAAYRRSRGQAAPARVGVVVQRFLDAEVSGVLFTRNPVTGADERVIEASWGLGEAVVGGLVTPDHYRVDRRGSVRELRRGEKDVEIVASPDGGTEEREVPPSRAARLTLDDRVLHELLDLAAWCEDLDLHDAPLDIEWCVAGGEVHLLQIRPMTA